MRMSVALFPFLLTLFASAPLGKNRDTTPPTARWISPQPYAIISTNYVRVAVKAKDAQSGVDKVRFYVHYIDYRFKKVDHHFIGEAEKHPYEVIWDCGNIPDQSFQRTSFTCEVFDKAGNKTVLGGNQRHGNFVIDRQSKPKTQTLTAFWRTKKFKLDGKLDDWQKQQGITFRNYENKVSVYATWSKAYLFLAVVVKDNSVISQFRRGGKRHDGFHKQDGIELFLDVDHDHNEIMNKGDKQFILSAGGQVLAIVSDTLRQHRTFDPDDIIRFKSRLLGTFNNPEDQDKGYIMEIALPWQALGMAPRSRLSLGLEVFNTNLNDLKGVNHSAGWSIRDGASLKNPSEWGNLVLEKKANRWKNNTDSGGSFCNCFLFNYILSNIEKKKRSTPPTRAKSGCSAGHCKH